MPHRHWMPYDKVISVLTLDDIFVIGGLVDRTVIKNASLNRAH